ncbi:MAG: hypothetical protein ACO3GL_03655 [Bacteroidia bacterium]
MRQYGLLFLMLGLPVVIYLLYVNTAENRYQSLPIFGPRKVLPTAVADGKSHPDDTLFFELPGVRSWTAGSINPVHIVHLVRYDGAVQRLGLRKAQAARIQDVFKKNPLVHQFCLGVKSDEAIGTPKDASRWSPMLPLEQVLDSVDQVQLWQDLRVFTPDWQRIFHQIPQEDLTLLVDRRGRVRGFYRGVLKDQTDRLMEDTRTLIAEYANTPNRRRRRL